MNRPKEAKQKNYTVKEVLVPQFIPNKPCKISCTLKMSLKPKYASDGIEDVVIASYPLSLKEETKNQNQ